MTRERKITLAEMREMGVRGVPSTAQRPIHGRMTFGYRELVWDRAFGRPFNAVVLPSGWMLTNSSIPSTIGALPDGRTRLDFINPRPDEVAVLITARRRSK